MNLASVIFIQESHTWTVSVLFKTNEHKIKIPKDTNTETVYVFESYKTLSQIILQTSYVMY